ncbi:unnamed protein product [Cylindrotheca closterium]|uniref:Uncharacterized protein n=1 Tax=Cylindrotheca closterium TaxID=2856 RepID=A0AAD2PVQ9_9STRA|nr:unnamed protein product [Cylindrotheca closterium]
MEDASKSRLYENNWNTTMNSRWNRLLIFVFCVLIQAGTASGASLVDTFELVDSSEIQPVKRILSPSRKRRLGGYRPPDDSDVHCDLLSPFLQSMYPQCADSDDEEEMDPDERPDDTGIRNSLIPYDLSVGIKNRVLNLEETRYVRYVVTKAVSKALSDNSPFYIPKAKKGGNGNGGNSSSSSSSDDNRDGNRERRLETKEETKLRLLAEEMMSWGEDTDDEFAWDEDSRYEPTTTTMAGEDLPSPMNTIAPTIPNRNSSWGGNWSENGTESWIGNGTESWIGNGTESWSGNGTESWSGNWSGSGNNSWSGGEQPRPALPGVSSSPYPAPESGPPPPDGGGGGGNDPSIWLWRFFTSAETPIHSPTTNTQEDVMLYPMRVEFVAWWRKRNKAIVKRRVLSEVRKVCFDVCNRVILNGELYENLVHSIEWYLDHNRISPQEAEIAAWLLEEGNIFFLDPTEDRLPTYLYPLETEWGRRESVGALLFFLTLVVAWGLFFFSIAKKTEQPVPDGSHLLTEDGVRNLLTVGWKYEKQKDGSQLFLKVYDKANMGYSDNDSVMMGGVEKLAIAEDQAAPAALTDSTDPTDRDTATVTNRTVGGEGAGSSGQHLSATFTNNSSQENSDRDDDNNSEDKRMPSLKSKSFDTI